MPEVIPPFVASIEDDPWWRPLSSHPEQTYGLETFPVDPGRLARSRDGVRALKSRHDKDNDSRNYVWRLGLSPATGLPVSLRTFQTLPDDDKAAQESFFASTELTQAIFGTPESPVTGEELIPGPTLRLNSPGEDGAQKQPRHLTWRQVYKGWPVIGGSVRAHAWTGDRRVLVTSSYFPLPDRPPSLSADPKVVATLEARSLRAYMRVAPKAGALAALSRVIDLYQPVSGGQAERLLKLLGEEQPPWVLETARAWWTTGDKPQSQITARPIPVNDVPECIVPFGGSYHASRRYAIGTSEGEADPWYVDIDIATGEVLGGAWQAVAAAPDYYRTSGEALARAPEGDLSSLPGPAFGAWLGGMFSNGAVLPAGNVDDKTVAASAWKMKEHLVTVCGVPRAQLEPANQPFTVELRSRDRTGFAYDSFRARKLIRFEADPGNGISEGANVVYAPASDPEVVMHECAHAFLWLIDSAPWDTPPTVNPFARALHEGYAMYLSRSAGANPIDIPGQSEEDEVWARGSYTRKKRNDSDNWLDRWLFVRAGQDAGADLLPAPNVYPSGAYSPRDILVYDVGMVWARALWDLRRLVGRAEADWLIVQAYPYLHGYIANFGLAAEAILDVDARRTSVDLANGIQPVWAIRNLAAASGVRSFAQTSTTGRLVAGTPSGILAWDPAAGRWQAETGNLLGGSTLTGIVALAAYGDTLYAAVELPPVSAAGQGTHWRPGIYEWTAASGVWSPRGDWAGDTDGRSPLCLLSPQPGALVVGTSRGVYAWDAANLAWQPFGGGDNAFAALQLTVSGGVFAAVSPQDLYYLSVIGWGRADVTVFGGAISTTRLTGLATLPGNGTTHVGSLTGLWRVSASAKMLVSPTATAVLAMQVGVSKLYFSTSDGVQALDAAGVNHLGGQPHDLPSDALVISLFERPGGDLLVGTAAHGIWRYDAHNQDWSQMPTPLMPVGFSVTAGEQLLVGLAHPGQLGVHILDNNAHVDVQEVSRPGFPLQRIMPSAGGTYHVEAGPVILRLAAVSAGNAQVSVTANGDIVLN